MKPIKTILHPTDFSECSMNALDTACSLARGQDARLIVLHVVPHPPAVFWSDETPPPPLSERIDEDLIAYRKEIEHKLQSLEISNPTLFVERLFLDGDASKVILAIAEKTSCDLIVMGSHGSRGLTRGLLGSVAQEVSRKAPCPVVTVINPRRSPVSTSACGGKQIGCAISH